MGRAAALLLLVSASCGAAGGATFRPREGYVRHVSATEATSAGGRCREAAGDPERGAAERPVASLPELGASTTCEVALFLTELPPRPYAVVGTIVVAERADPERAIDEALALARRVGCDLIIDRTMALELGLAGHVLVAQLGATVSVSPAGGVIGAHGRERRRDEFVCGVWR